MNLKHGLQSVAGSRLIICHELGEHVAGQEPGDEKKIEKFGENCSRAVDSLDAAMLSSKESSNSHERRCQLNTIDFCSASEQRWNRRDYDPDVQLKAQSMSYMVGAQGLEPR